MQCVMICISFSKLTFAILYLTFHVSDMKFVNIALLGKKLPCLFIHC